ncbi:MAG: hypothetical protein JXA78_08460 [Anaerolineales bacterium]|nr:hypothetical protein [Anaerolineales bacterium]
MPAMDHTIESVRQVLQRFQDGYRARDPSALDDFMQLFVDSDEIELIGVGAYERNGYEWFQGVQAVRQIVEGDWMYWGDVVLDVAGAKIHVHGEAAWLSTTGAVIQRLDIEETLVAYLGRMKELLEDDRSSPEARLVEATHFGMRRWRERVKGQGYPWPFTFSAVLVWSETGWRFHTIHWAMPVD